MSRSIKNQKIFADCRAQSSLIVLVTISVCLALLLAQQPADCSIGYFEAYGWPTYGIVKPFWMTPFSAFPSRSLSGYSRKHSMYNGRGVLNYKGY